MSNSKFKTALSEGIKKPGFLTICITLVMLILTAALQPGFFKGTTIGSNINTFAPLILLTMGQAVVIIAGGLDLSIGYAVSMLVVILTNIMQKDNPATAIPAILVAFVAAILVGVINGFSVGFLRLPPLIVTYATSYIWLGIGLFIAPSPAGQCVNWVRIFYTFSAIENLPPALATLGKTLPPSFWLIVIACIIWACIRKSRTGRHIYAVGSNSDSAYYSGINTANVQMKAYIICAVFTSCAHCSMQRRTSPVMPVWVTR
ncbi:MAG: ABC transporter permease [Clostridia bacterium]|nr:ABC transporter permease [Clostridia bacterium]